VGGDGRDDNGNVRGVSAARVGGGMENLKELLRHAVDGHEELGAWNSRAVEAIRILDRMKVNWEGGGNDLLFVFYLHMGMGEINWREEGDPMINRISPCWSDLRVIIATLRTHTLEITKRSPN
jgi:hypothetical protein